MTKVSQVPNTLLTFFLSPFIYDAILRYLYGTDALTVLGQGLPGLEKYVIADILTLLVVLLLIALAMSGMRRASVMIVGGRRGK